MLSKSPRRFKNKYSFEFGGILGRIGNFEFDVYTGQEKEKGRNEDQSWYYMDFLSCGELVLVVWAIEWVDWVGWPVGGSEQVGTI